jgi:hypothetical protein
MGSLTIAIEECPSGRPIGTLLLDTSRIDVSRPLQVRTFSGGVVLHHCPQPCMRPSSSCSSSNNIPSLCSSDNKVCFLLPGGGCLVQASVPCLGANKQLLATADVSLRIRYSALLSSFEMAEHLASADKALPLYPSPPAAAHRQQATAAAAEAAATGAAGTAAPAAPGPGSTQPASTPQKQQQQQPETASGAVQPAGNTVQAATSSAATAAAPVPGATGNDAGTPPAAAAAGQQPPADAISEVIRKAEQLKASLDQAAKAGVMLALPRIQQQQQQQRLTVQQLLQGQGYSPTRPPALLPGPGGSSSSRVLPLPADVLGPQGWVPGGAGLLGRQAAAAAGPPLLLGPAGSRRHKHRARAGGGNNGSSSSDDDERSSSGGSSLDHAVASSRSRHHHRRRRSSSGSSGGSSHDSSLLAELDGLEELEDLLLQELLNLRTPAAAAAAAAAAAGTSRHKPHSSSSSKHAHRQASPAKNTSPGKGGQQQLEKPEGGEQSVQAGEAQVSGGSEEQQQPANAAADASPQLHVELLSLRDLPAAVSAVTAVLKCAGQQQALDATALVQQQQQQQQQAGLAVVSTTLAGPSSLLQPLLSAQRPCLVVELWTGLPDTSLQVCFLTALHPSPLHTTLSLPHRLDLCLLRNRGAAV